MNLTIRLFGREVLAIDTDPSDDGDRGDATSTPVAFGFGAWEGDADE